MAHPSLRIAALAGCLLWFAACAHERVWVPPRVDLASYGTIGIVTITSQQEPGLGPLATTELMALIHRAQPGVPIVELGGLESLLAELGLASAGPAAMRAIGEAHGVDALLVGELTLEPLSPNFSLNDFRHAGASADLRGALSARLLLARSGATVWTQSAHRSEQVAGVSLAHGRPSVGARDPSEAESRLLRGLVGALCGDFWGRWQRI